VARLARAVYVRSAGLPLSARRYGRGSREMALRSAWTPAVSPSCASSPAAWTAVVTSSSPSGWAGGLRGALDRGRGPGSRARFVATDGRTAAGRPPRAWPLAGLGRGLRALGRGDVVLAADPPESSLGVDGFASPASGCARRALRRWGRVEGRLDSTSPALFSSDDPAIRT
jgi:hypothetical protein